MNKRCNLIQVLPRITPKECGISDHAILLAEVLREKHNIDTIFITSFLRHGDGINFPVICCSIEKLPEICAKNFTNGIQKR